MIGTVKMEQDYTCARLHSKFHKVCMFLAEVISGSWITRFSESLDEAYDNEDIGDNAGKYIEKIGKSRQELNWMAEDILDSYGNNILRLAYSYLHNMDDAEEILQETLLKYLQEDVTFENKSHEKAWILKVAANLSKNRIRYNKVREADELDEQLATEETKCIIGGYDVTVKGNDGRCSLAIWSDGTYSYSIQMTEAEGISYEELDAIISSL